MSTIPYVPTYLRAMPPTIWPVTSPLDFGAIGNGSADDYPAITAALHALAAKGGGTLVFPNDRDFRIATPGVHGIHIKGQSNITIMMGERSRLIMDNMVDGLAVSHGIFVEGPCENISLIGVHAMFATLSVSRQVWAPIYFLGANVGQGDASLAPALGWYRGNPDGTEAWQQIEAGAVKNVYLENVTSQNSPSVGIGIVGVDGLRGYNITLRDTWADGLYHVFFRNSRIDGYYGVNVGDDGISLASYESDLEAADIELPFHGEGSVFSNIVLEGRTGDTPSGSIVPLGVRDVKFSGIVVRDRYRGIKLEPGTQLTTDYPTLCLNFLANRRVIIDDMTIHGGTQDISLYCKECNFGTPEKWWRHDMIISNFIGESGSSAFDFFGAGIPRNGGPPLPMVAGITFKNLVFSNYASPYTTLAGLVDCTIDGLQTDSFISVQGSVPYGSDPDLLDGDGDPVWHGNYCTFRNIKGSSIVFQGLKFCMVEAVESLNAPNRAFAFTTCADVQIRGMRVLYPNRVNDQLDNSALSIDEYCKRIVASDIYVEQDDHVVHAVGLLNDQHHRVENVTVRTTQGPAAPFVAMVSDRAWIDSKTSQVGRVEWFHENSTISSGTREFPLSPILAGDAAADVFSPVGRRYRLVYPLSADRLWTLHDDEAVIGDRVEVVRDPSSSGPYSISFRGQSGEISAFPTADAASTSLIAGAIGGAVSSILVSDTVELLGDTVYWATSNVATTSALAAAINARTETTGFTATAYLDRLTINAPAGSGVTYNNAKIEATTAGGITLSVGHIPRMTGGSDTSSAGERAATSSFLLLGDYFPGFHGSITSITINGTELLAAPVIFQQNNNVFADLVATAVTDNFEAHGYTCFAGRNTIFFRAPPGHGASANGWPVVVTPTGDVTAYDVHALATGVDKPEPTAAGEPYAIATTTPGAPFRAIFEFTAPGWRLASLSYDQPRYPNGRPIYDSDNRLLDIDGHPISDEFKNRKYANGAVLGYDSGMLAMGLSAPPATSAAFGVAGMQTYDADYLYLCTAANTWKRIALSSF